MRPTASAAIASVASVASVVGDAVDSIAPAEEVEVEKEEAEAEVEAEVAAIDEVLKGRRMGTFRSRRRRERTVGLVSPIPPS